MPRLAVIIGSTRPGRAGRPIGEWFVRRADAHGAFDVDQVDLADLALPLLDEPAHPRTGNYVHEHTKAWSARIAAADAVVMVTPEYNFGYSAVLKNAIDYLHGEWLYKPVGFVSYGGVAGGTRAVQQLKQVVTTLRMIPVFEAVTIPFHSELIAPPGRFEPGEATERAADSMLTELLRMVPASAVLREPGLVS
jgi:NAD(P)H-dependent FMN reductase